MSGNNLAKIERNTQLKLTDMQEKYVDGILAGLRPADAMRAAGYSERMAKEPTLMLRSSIIAAAIKLAVTQRLLSEGLPLAYSVLCELARSPNEPGAVRRAAARDLMDRAGFVAPKAIDAASAGADKPLSEMSSDELRGLVDKLESELGARALPVNAQPLSPTKAKLLDWLE
jgi:hypothetical protein